MAESITLPLTLHGFDWPERRMWPVVPVQGFRGGGLRQSASFLRPGCPAHRHARVQAKQAAEKPPDSFTPLYPPDVSSPVTAFLRFEGNVADVTCWRDSRLELYNPLNGQNIDINGHAVPLESDLTTPLAYFLKQQKLDGMGEAAYLRPDRYRDRAGFYLMEPYQPGKIPVILVHGLRGSPLNWARVYNDLRADAELRKHFQFWFYFYPSGNLYLAAGADLRDQLTRMRQQLDPAAKDPALDRMVLIGHSMGGLVAKLAAVDSGDAFWQLVSKQPLDSLRTSPETRAELQRIFFFHPQPSVRCVVFIGTLHHGTQLVAWPPIRLFLQLAHTSKTLADAAPCAGGAECQRGAAHRPWLIAVLRGHAAWLAGAGSVGGQAKASRSLLPFHHWRCATFRQQAGTHRLRNPLGRAVGWSNFLRQCPS